MNSFQQALDQLDKNAQNTFGIIQSKKSLWQKIKDRNAIAAVILTNNTNNPITPPFYLLLKVGDGVFQIYTAFIILYSLVMKTDISDIWIVEEFLYTIPDATFLIIQISLFIWNLLISGLFIGQILTYDSRKRSFDKQPLIFNLTLPLMMLTKTIFSIPFLIVIFKCFGNTIDKSNLGVCIALLVFNIINLFLFVSILMFMRRIYQIRTESTLVPWSGMDSTELILEFFIKVIQVAFYTALSFAQEMLASYIVILTAAFVIYTILTSIRRIMLPPLPNRTVDIVTTMIQQTNISIFLHILLIFIEEDKDNTDLFYLLIIIPLMNILPFFMTQLWSNYISNKIIENTLKRQIEYKFAFYILEERVKHLSGSKYQLKESISQLVGLIKAHNKKCTKENCICQHSDSVLWILRRATIQNKSILNIYAEELDLLNKIKSEEFIPKVVLTDASFTLNDFLDRQYSNFDNTDISGSSNINNSSNVGDSNRGGPENDENNQNFDEILYRIDINKLLVAYLVNFIKMYYQEALQKFPDASDINLCYAHFSLHILRSCFCCMNIIRSFQHQGLGWIEKISVKMNELYIVQLLEKFLKTKNSFENGFQYQRYGVIEDEQALKRKSIEDILGEENLDANHFIHINLLQFQFTQTIQKLSFTILDFWKLLQSKDFMVDKILEAGNEVSEQIDNTYSIFQNLENAVKQKDHKIYFNFAIIQKQLLNDNQSHDLYLTKMKGILTMQKLLKNNYYKVNSDLDVGILLVFGQTGEFGKIIFANQVLQKFLGYSSQDFRHQRIGLIQPQIIKHWHPAIMKDFQQSGASRLIHHNTNLFLKKKNGYVMPSQMNIQYHYSMIYGHTFIAFINRIVEMPLQKMGQKYPVEKIMFYLCDPEEGRINDISENCNQMLGLSINHILTNELNSEKSNLTIKEICPQIDLQKLKQNSINNQGYNKIYENLIDLNLEVIKVLKSSSKQYYIQKKCPAMCMVVQEQYSRGLFGMTIVAIMPLQDQTQILGAKQVKSSSYNFMPEEAQNQDIEDNNSMSGSSQSASSTSSHNTEMIKQSVSSMKKTTPRSLKIVIQLILFVFLIMISISSINLYLALDRQQKLVIEIDTVKRCYDRITQTAKARVVTRMITNMAAGLEPTSSSFLPQRFDSLKSLLERMIQETKETQTFLDNVDFDYSSEFRQFMDDSNVPLEYLDEQGRDYHMNQTMSFTINVYVNSLFAVFNMNQTQLKGKIPLLNFGQQIPGYKPTQEERTIYFVSQNGQNAVRQFNRKYINQYTLETKEHAENSKTQTETTIIISIASIVLIGLIVAPILAKIYDRQYIAVGFFINLNQEVVQEIVEKIAQCCEILAQVQKPATYLNNYQGNHHKKTSAFGSQNHVQQVAQFNIKNLREPTNEQSAYENYNHESFDIDESEDVFSPSVNERSRNLNDRNTEEIDYVAYKNTDQVNNQTYVFDQLSKIGTNKQKFTLRVRPQEESHSFYNDGRAGAIGNTTNKTDINNRGHTVDEILDKTNKTQIQTLAHEEVDEEKKAAEQYEEEKLERQKIIKKIMQSKKIKTIAQGLFLIIMLSSYFIISYFMALRTYNSVPETLENLNIIYFKDACLENVIAFVRENIMRNTTMKLTEDNTTDASTYQLNDCYSKENDYRNLRKNIPPAFKDVQWYIEAIERDNYCNLIFENDKAKVEWCENTYHGIVNKGLSNYFQIILNNLQNLDLKYKNGPKDKNTLQNYMWDNTTLLLIGIKNFIVDNSLQKFRLMATDSVNDYYATLIREYTILYGCFICLLLILFVVFIVMVFRRLRAHMWKTNMTLKILPIEYLNSEKHKQLKLFFQ